MSAAAAWLPGGRLHLQHGPIDLICDAEGPGREDALRAAEARFRTVLDELVAELPRLRQAEGAPLQGPVARRMAAAIAPFAPVFVTPMAAVAGAVADEVLDVMRATGKITKAYVNNGGDVAFHLEDAAHMTAHLAADPPARIGIGAGDPVRGMATSGWAGRSNSLGIADSVTVLARNAAAADAAATLIANAVDLPGHPAVTRAPASDRAPDSDLGDRLVTIGVGALKSVEIDTALRSGEAFTQTIRARGLIHSAALILQGQMRLVGAMPMIETKEPAHA